MSFIYLDCQDPVLSNRPFNRLQPVRNLSEKPDHAKKYMGCQ